MVNREIVLPTNVPALDKVGMTLGQRIEERRLAVGISQAELARRVGVRQSTMNSLINGESRSSRSIVQIARELRTTPAYLIGDTNDPDMNAPPLPPAPIVHHVTMQVALPSENALARMFEGLLATIHELQPISELPMDALARELAQLLPTGLSQLKGRLHELPSGYQAGLRADAEAPATADPGPLL